MKYLIFNYCYLFFCLFNFYEKDKKNNWQVNNSLISKRLTSFNSIDTLPRKDSLFKKKVNTKTLIIGFYNLENLFDTLNDPKINDEDFLPTSIKHYTSKIYEHKINNLGSVISKIGIEENPAGLVILGIAELENNIVIDDLIKQKDIIHRGYKYIHYNSKDARGIDVGLMYQPQFFKPIEHFPISLTDATHYTNYFTRDILYVNGLLNNEFVHIFVNHWPSRKGGEMKSAAGRKWAAAVCRKYVDSIFKKNIHAKIIIMGDLNDNPDDKSLTKYLKAKSNFKKLVQSDLYNPFYNVYKSGLGSIAQDDVWGLFDQIIISAEWVNKKTTGYIFQQPKIYTDNLIIESYGRYKGYPLRTWNGNLYRGGFSDHFPTYIIIRN